jgi:hypothetical protein
MDLGTLPGVRSTAPDVAYAIGSGVLKGEVRPRALRLIYATSVGSMQETNGQGSSMT